MQSIITDSTITLISETGPSVIGKTHPNFYKIKKALLQKNFLEVENMLDVKNGYKEFSNGRIAVDGDNLIYDGAIIHNVLTQRIVEMIHNGDEATPMLNFLVNLMDNPSEGSIDQLYTFLEHENLPITEDGCFLAYKAINRDYTDKYTGTISNKVGDKVKMPYEEVTADPTKHCSSGLHCGSIDYVRCYGNFKTDENGEHIGDRLVTVKVNPNAVVSVPEDSDRQKVRVYRYVVHEEIENPYDLVPKYEAPVYYDSEGNVYDEDVFGDDDYENYEHWDEDEWTPVDDGVVPDSQSQYDWVDNPYSDQGHDDSNLYSEKGLEGEPGNPVEGLIDFDDVKRKESIIAGCIRQSTDNPLKKNSFETDDIVGDVDVDMFDAMYNNTDYATEQPSEKNSFDSVEKTSESESCFIYDWHGVANTEWDVIHTINNDKRRENMHPKAREIFEYYENKYGMNITDSVTINSIIGDLKDVGFDMSGNPLKESKDQKNFLDEMFQDASCYAKKDAEKNSFDVVEKDSNEESVVDIEKPNNIILPDNN
jgi:hypothetical protein